jgi:hypothetical protein
VQQAQPCCVCSLTHAQYNTPYADAAVITLATGGCAHASDSVDSDTSNVNTNSTVNGSITLALKLVTRDSKSSRVYISCYTRPATAASLAVTATIVAVVLVLDKLLLQCNDQPVQTKKFAKVWRVTLTYVQECACSLQQK